MISLHVSNIRFHNPNIKKTSQSKLKSKSQEGELHLQSVKVRSIRIQVHKEFPEINE